MESFVIYVLSLLCIDSMCLAKSLNCTKIMKLMILKYFKKYFFCGDCMVMFNMAVLYFLKKVVLSRAGESTFLAS